MVKINITYLITGLTPGGAELTLKNIILNLDLNRYNISIVSMTNTFDLYPSLKKVVNKIYFLDARNILDFPKAFITLRKILKRENPDILHCVMFHSNILGRISAYKCKCKVISFQLSVLSTNYIGNFIDRLTQGLVDSYMVNAYSISNFIQGYGIKKNKISIFYNLVDYDRFNEKIDPMDLKNELNLPNLPILTMVANFKKQKDYPTMIRAISEVQKKRDVIFLALGTGLKFENEMMKVQKLIKNLKLKNIYLLGFRDDVPEILAITDIWVCSTLFEGQSNSLLEAMAMKKPIITTDIPENSEVLKNNVEALLVHKKSPQSMAKAIIRLLDDQELSNKLASNAFKKVKKYYNISNTIKQLENLYSTLLEDK